MEEDSDSGEDFEYYDEEDESETKGETTITTTSTKSNYDLIDFISKMDIPT